MNSRGIDWKYCVTLLLNFVKNKLSSQLLPTNYKVQRNVGDVSSRLIKHQVKEVKCLVCSISVQLKIKDQEQDYGRHVDITFLCPAPLCQSHDKGFKKRRTLFQLWPLIPCFGFQSQGGSPCLYASSPVDDGSFRFISGVTLAELQLCDQHCNLPLFPHAFSSKGRKPAVGLKSRYSRTHGQVPLPTLWFIKPSILSVGW